MVRKPIGQYSRETGDSAAGAGLGRLDRGRDQPRGRRGGGQTGRGVYTVRRFSLDNFLVKLFFFTGRFWS